MLREATTFSSLRPGPLLTSLLSPAWHPGNLGSLLRMKDSYHFPIGRFNKQQSRVPMSEIHTHETLT